MLASGGRGVGKTIFIENLLSFRNEITATSPKRIVLCYTKHGAEVLKELFPMSSPYKLC